MGTKEKWSAEGPKIETDLAEVGRETLNIHGMRFGVTLTEYVPGEVLAHTAPNMALGSSATTAGAIDSVAAMLIETCESDLEGARETYSRLLAAASSDERAVLDRFGVNGLVWDCTRDGEWIWRASD